MVEPACRACGGASSLWTRTHGHDFWRCLTCGSLFFAVSPPADGKLYDHYYDQARFEITEVVRVALERIVRSASSFRSTGRWLDVGYGEGALLDVAAAHGWQCFGTEVCPPVLAYGARRGWTIAMELRDPLFPEGGFDVVTMIELIEHVPHPKALLADAARLLRPGGLLFVTTPNANSINRHLLSGDWTVFCPPEHLTIWTRNGLRRAFRDAGLEPVRFRTEGLNPAEILSRYRPKRAGAAPVNRNQAALALNSGLSRTGPRRMLKSAINEGLSLLGVGDTLKSWAVRPAK